MHTLRNSRCEPIADQPSTSNGHPWLSACAIALLIAAGGTLAVSQTSSHHTSRVDSAPAFQQAAANATPGAPDRGQAFTAAGSVGGVSIAEAVTVYLVDSQEAADAIDRRMNAIAQQYDEWQLVQQARVLVVQAPQDWAAADRSIAQFVQQYGAERVRLRYARVPAQTAASGETGICGVSSSANC